MPAPIDPPVLVECLECENTFEPRNLVDGICEHCVIDLKREYDADRAYDDRHEPDFDPGFPDYPDSDLWNEY